MVSGVSYERAFAVDVEVCPEPSAWGMHVREFLEILRRVSGRRWDVALTGYGKRFADFVGRLTVGEYVLIIRCERERYGHYIAVSVPVEGDVMVHDPDMDNPLPLHSYKARGDWKVVRVFSPR